jgi:hypothetical protein
MVPILFMCDEMLKENIDGEAVEWAYRRLRGQFYSNTTWIASIGELGPARTNKLVLLDTPSGRRRRQGRTA